MKLLSGYNDFRGDFNVKERGVCASVTNSVLPYLSPSSSLRAYVYVIAIRKAATKMQIRRIITAQAWRTASAEVDSVECPPL